MFWSNLKQMFSAIWILLKKGLKQGHYGQFSLIYLVFIFIHTYKHRMIWNWFPECRSQNMLLVPWHISFPFCKDCSVHLRSEEMLPLAQLKNQKLNWYIILIFNRQHSFRYLSDDWIKALGRSEDLAVQESSNQVIFYDYRESPHYAKIVLREIRVRGSVLKTQLTRKSPTCRLYICT